MVSGLVLIVLMFNPDTAKQAATFTLTKTGAFFRPSVDKPAASHRCTNLRVILERPCLSTVKDFQRPQDSRADFRQETPTGTVRSVQPTSCWRLSLTRSFYLPGTGNGPSPPVDGQALRRNTREEKDIVAGLPQLFSRPPFHPKPYATDVRPWR